MPRFKKKPSSSRSSSRRSTSRGIGKTTASSRKSARSETGKPTHARIEIGDRVRFRLGADDVDAHIIEDRGNIGVGGRRILRVRTVGGSPEEVREFEVPEAEVEPVT